MTSCDDFKAAYPDLLSADLPLFGVVEHILKTTQTKVMMVPFAPLDEDATDGWQWTPIPGDSRE